jgi:HPt (histidine-containing phosphotransfer) domain-containing protein
MSAKTVFQARAIEALRLQLGDEGGRLLRDIIELYLEQARDLVAQIEAEDATVDCERLRALAHKLKGSTATVGGDRLAAACQRIESAQSAGFDARSATQAVRQEFDMLAQELAHYRRSLL